MAGRGVKRVVGWAAHRIFMLAISPWMAVMDDLETLRARIIAILAELDAIPDLPDAVDPLEWDEIGLPR